MLGVVLGMIVVWIMLAVRDVDRPVLIWFGWAAALVAAALLDLSDRMFLGLLLAVPAILARMTPQPRRPGDTVSSGHDGARCGGTRPAA